MNAIRTLIARLRGLSDTYDDGYQAGYRQAWTDAEQLVGHRIELQPDWPDVPVPPR